MVVKKKAKKQSSVLNRRSKTITSRSGPNGFSSKSPSSHAGSSTELKDMGQIIQDYGYDLSKVKNVSPSSLKPIRARQLIRRFHNLLKYKGILLKQIEDIQKESVYEDIEIALDVNDAYLEIELKKLGEKFQVAYIDRKREVIKELKVNSSLVSSEDLTTNMKTKIMKKGSNRNFTNDLIEICKELGNIDGEIVKRGGLQVYQVASTLGQDGKRGGDSSKKLVEWIKEHGIFQEEQDKKPIALEIGCLSSKNLISTCGIFESVIRMDLKSQEPDKIIEIDFMKYKRPANVDVDLISCSLVLNFVPSAKLRGEMLLKIRDCLLPNKSKKKKYLFMVLPLPCIDNSRYMNENLFNNVIMQGLGFDKIYEYKSHKIVYYLYEFHESKADYGLKYDKKEVNSGSKRNNFCVVIE